MNTFVKFQGSDNNTTPLSPPDPRFLHDRIQRYYTERVENAWAGGHPMKGRSPRPGDVQMRTNDYLGLAGHPKVIAAEVSALRAGGHGDAVSRVWLHKERDSIAAFEGRLARVLRAEDAVLVNSGYCANVGLIQAITEPDAPVFVDMKAHISLWEGISSAKAVPRPFRHNSAAHLERQILKHGPGVVAVDALYSTDGAVAPLADIVDVVERHGCVLVVDETHSFGAHGKNGGGLCVALGLEERVHFRTIGLSKAVASRGGAIACSKRNAEYFRYESLPVIFSTSVLQHEVAGYDAVLDILANETWRQAQLHRNHHYLRGHLDALGYNVDVSAHQIIALEAGPQLETMRLRDALESRGVFGAIFFPPATPEKRCLIRFTLNCGHTRAELDHVISVCRDVRDELDVPGWASSRRRKGIAAASGVISDAKMQGTSRLRAGSDERPADAGHDQEGSQEAA
ncbi:MAG: alpha-hydroxyketone-type quorum-sensing autoinducer synthase [Pseudomonadota bacterium]